MAIKLNEGDSFFLRWRAGDDHDCYEKYKTIIMAKSNTATAATARQEAVYGAVYGVISMYVHKMGSVTLVQWVVVLSVSSFTTKSCTRLLVRFPSPQY